MGPLLRLIRFPKMVSILGTAPYRNCANDLPATQHKQRHRLALRQPRLPGLRCVYQIPTRCDGWGT